jgi:hypothetical protein
MISLVVNNAEKLSRRGKAITYVPSFSGVYTQGGDGVNFLTATNPNAIPSAIPSNAAPSEIKPGSGVAGYEFEFIIGSNATNGLLKVYTASGTELNAGAYPAALLADMANMRFDAIFRF